MKPALGISMLLTSIGVVWLLLATLAGAALLRASKRAVPQAEVGSGDWRNARFEPEPCLEVAGAAQGRSGGRFNSRAKRVDVWQAGSLGAHDAAHA